MALYALGDTHLSFAADKPMDVFGGAWENYTDKLARGLSVLTEEDTLVLCGDISWAMNFEDVAADFSFLNAFPGRKLLLKGNHDYWWTTAAKMRRFFSDRGFCTLEILHNNAWLCDGAALCGTRGWFYEEDQKKGTHDEKVFLRECGRLETSLKEGLKLLGQKDGRPSPELGEKLYVFLHYPPLYEGYRCDEIVRIMESYHVKRCFYGHLHGPAQDRAIEGDYRGVRYRMLSADHVNFQPVKIQ